MSSDNRRASNGRAYETSITSSLAVAGPSPPYELTKSFRSDSDDRIETSDGTKVSMSIVNNHMNRWN